MRVSLRTALSICLSCILVSGFNFNFQQKAMSPKVTPKVNSIALSKFTAPIVVSFMSVVLSANLARAAELKTYTNARYHTVLSYPADFEEKSGSISGDRDVVAFVDPTDPDTSASLVFSPVPAGERESNDKDI
jgi:hypothetical protein